MELSMLLTIGLGLVLVSIIVAYIVLTYVRPSSVSSLSPKEGLLASPVNIGSSDDVKNGFYSPSGSTFNCYFFIYPTQRTQILNKDANEQQKLFSLGSGLEFQILTPGVSNPKPSARLKIRTSTPNGVNDEYISVPHPPTQQWVLLSLVRDARRYTVYYNENPVASGRTINFPIITTSTIRIGDSSIQGKYGLPKIVPRSFTKYDIIAYRKTSCDSRGKPYLPSESMIPTFSVVAPSICVGGSCLTTSSVSNPNPLQKWYSPYA